MGPSIVPRIVVMAAATLLAGCGTLPTGTEEPIESPSYEQSEEPSATAASPSETAGERETPEPKTPKPSPTPSTFDPNEEKDAGPTVPRGERPETPEPSATGGSTESQAGPAIPRTIRGRWGKVASASQTPSKETCGNGFGSAGKQLRISRDSIGYFETEASLTEVLQEDPSRLLGRFREQNGDQTSSRKILLDAKQGGESLVVRDGGSAPLTSYRRCP